MKIAMMACLAVLVTALPAAAQKVEPGDATWHIGLTELWGKEERGGQGRNLDIYPVFEGGKWVRALATARRYNTSIHFVEQSTVTLKGDKVSGRLRILLTPDQWVPKDGQPIVLEAEIDGKLKASGDNHTLSGTYVATIEGKQVRGKLIGGTGATETGWENSVLSSRMNQVPDGPSDLPPQITLTVGVGDGKVHRGRLGVSYKGPAPLEHRFDVGGLKYDGAEVRGKVSMPARAVRITADPKDQCEMDLTVIRVQGLVGARATFQIKRGGKPVGEPFRAFGRGTGHQGGGAGDPDGPQPLWQFGVDTDPWSTPVADHAPPKPDEHPRLLFRRSDLPALRAKMKTPEGQAILKRLRETLNGGDGQSLPKARRSPDIPYGDSSKPVEQPVGAYSMSHAAGYGLLWQLTGEQKYADMGRTCFEWAFEGYRDRDGKARYSFRKPTGALRAGTALGWYAVGYDLCADGWDPAFRKRVALALQNYDEGEKMSLESLAKGSIVPGSNHYGMQVGGAGLALLAIMNDTGVDMKKVEPLLEDCRKASIDLMRYGWGDGGFFAEGDGTGSMSAHITFLPSLIAWRHAAGKDFITPRPHAKAMVLKWIRQTIIRDGRIDFPQHGGYSHNIWARGGLSGAGYFAEGFGALPREYHPGLLWYYQQFLAERDAANGTPYDTVSPYPHFSVMSFINWPVDTEPVNPAKVMPLTSVDRVFGYFVNRNRWQDGNDSVVTLLLHNGPEGYIRVKDGGKMTLRGEGVSTTLKTDLRGATPVYYKAEKDGSSVLSVSRDGRINSVAVDFGGGSLIVVGVGEDFVGKKPRRGWPKGLNVSQHEVGGAKFAVVTLGEAGAAPKVSGDTLKVGERAFRFDGLKLVVD